jgi:hypothetical protein
VDSRRTLIYDDRGRLTRVEWSSGRVAIMERASIHSTGEGNVPRDERLT